jgi:acetyl-CoA C-acetyltransferase
MVYIHQAIRVPNGKVGGIYKRTPPENLMAHLMKNLPELPEEIILSTTVGTGGNMARFAALKAGYPIEIPASTLDAQCIGGMKSIEMGFALIASGLRKSVLVGGMESVSLAPIRMYSEKDPRHTGKPYSQAVFSPDGETSLFPAAERCAKDIDKENMWRWFKRSHLLASQSGTVLGPYLYPLEPEHTDLPFRPEIQLEAYSTTKKIDRTTTAPPADGAAVLYLSSEPKGALARIHTVKTIGTDPAFAPLGVRKAIQFLKSDPAKIDLFEISESFALIPEIFCKDTGIDESRVNVLGGTLAYGHPFGASGAIQVLHLLAALKGRNKRWGLTAIPGAGGLASALILENVI